MDFIAFRRIETARLLLRPFVSEDEGMLHEMGADPLVRRHLFDGRVPDAETVRGIVDAGVRSWEERGYGLCVVLRRSEPEGPGVGFVGIRDFADPQAGGEPRPELIYGLASKYWGRGYATESARAMLHFGFEFAGLAEIHGGIDPPNERSRRVLERLGFGRSGWRRLELPGLGGPVPADYAAIGRSGFAADEAPFGLLI